MATLDDLQQRPDLFRFSMDITKTLVSTAVAASATAAVAEVCNVCGCMRESACVCTCVQL